MPPIESGAAALISAQARLNPAAPALIDASSTISFAELDQWSDSLAQRFRQAGIGPGVLAGVFLDPSPSLIAALIALWKCGAAYVPLDPAYPKARLEFIARDARIAALITRAALREAAPPCDALPIVLDSDGPLHAPLAPHADFPAASPIAYVLYTSGSTGRPNGVMVGHDNVLRFFEGLDTLLGRQPGVWLWVTSISFDISVLEMFWTLSRGHTLVLPGALPVSDAILSHSVTHLQCTPSLARLLTAGSRGLAALAALNTILVGGEALPLALARRLRAATPARIFNMYGPTETTVWSAAWPLPSGLPDDIRIGRALAGERLDILDERGAPVPDGAAGEIYIGGSGVAHGYLGRPDLTAARFLPDPSVAPPARRYRTGDLGRRLPDGDIEFLGRADFQVKISGHRIELSEIENLLESHPAVQQAIVGMVDAGRDTARLLAWCVPAAPAPSPAALRQFLAAQLPEAVIPSAFVFLSQMPLTPNGKVDRGALRPPETLNPPPAIDSAPASPLEQTIAAELASILGRPSVPTGTNFIDLGAHSLQIAELHSRLEDRLSRSFPLVTLFRFTTVSALAAHLSSESASESAPLDAAAERARARRRVFRPAPGVSVPS